MLFIVFFVLLTISTLIFGIILMAIGGKINKKYSTRLMSLRVTMQALALFTLFCFYFYYSV
jgi:hypothetical protein